MHLIVPFPLDKGIQGCDIHSFTHWKARNSALQKEDTTSSYKPDLRWLAWCGYHTFRSHSVLFRFQNIFHFQKIIKNTNMFAFLNGFRKTWIESSFTITQLPRIFAFQLKEKTTQFFRKGVLLIQSHTTRHTFSLTQLHLSSSELPVQANLSNDGMHLSSFHLTEIHRSSFGNAYAFC